MGNKEKRMLSVQEKEIAVYSGALYQTLLQYVDIPQQEYETFTRLLSVSRLQKGEYLLRAGEIPTEFGFLISGIARLFYTDAEGNEFNKSFCLEGDFVASFSALLRNEVSRLSIQVLEDSTLMLANFREYVKLHDNHLCWQILSRRLAEELFIKKESRESQFLLEQAEERYVQFLQEYPGIEMRIRQYDIASYLGISPVALSRIRAKLRQA